MPSALLSLVLLSIGMVKIESMFMPRQNSKTALQGCVEHITTNRATISEHLMAPLNRIQFDSVTRGKHSTYVQILMTGSQQDIHVSNIWNFNNQAGFQNDAHLMAFSANPRAISKHQLENLFERLLHVIPFFPNLSPDVITLSMFNPFIKCVLMIIVPVLLFRWRRMEHVEQLQIMLEHAQKLVLF